MRLQSAEADDLWRAHCGDLLRLTTLLVGPNDADDIAVETFLGAYRSATGPHVLDSRSYLLGAVANHAASFRRSDPRNLRSITVSFEANPPADFQYWFMGDDLIETTMRGHPAFVTNRPGGEPGDTEPSIMWLERPDLMTTASGFSDITLDEVLAAAQSLQPMAAAQWDELQAAALSSGAHATTTVVTTIS